MAGGKETPRQKMIGMMYLVLTALLALNVSKQILDAFVAIEENIQRSALTQLDRGNAAKDEMRTAMADALSQKTPEMQQKAEKIKRYLSIVDLIDKEAAKVIKEIDDTKIMLMQMAGEDVTTVAENDEKAIIWKLYDAKEPLRPARLNLMAIQAKDQFDVPMHELVGADVKVIDESKKGIVIWKLYNDFRKKVVELAGSYQEGEKKYSVKVKDINEWTDNKDLDKKVLAMLTGNGNVINKEDVPALMGIYQELTKREIAKHHEIDGVHWLGRTFDHAPMVGALASLSSLQLEVLSARAKAINLLKSKISTGQFSFNKIVGMGFTNGSVFKPGDEVILNVFMGAFDSDKQPTVKPDQGTFIESKDGIAKIKLSAPSAGQELKLSGMVGIADKSGDIKWMPYGKDGASEIKVFSAATGASLEMPEFAILYAGYDNKIIATASGAVSFDISVSGAAKRKQGEMYLVKPALGAVGSKVSISINGKDASGKSISYGKAKVYDVKRFPPGQISSKTISKMTGGSINVEMDKSAPIKATFTVEQVEVLGIDNGICAGKIIPAAKLKSFRPGQTIGVRATVRNSITGGKDYVPGFLLVQ